MAALYMVVSGQVSVTGAMRMPWLAQQTFISPSSGSWNSKTKVSQLSCSGDGPVPDSLGEQGVSHDTVIKAPKSYQSAPLFLSNYFPNAPSPNSTVGFQVTTAEL